MPAERRPSWAGNGKSRRPPCCRPPAMPVEADVASIGTLFYATVSRFSGPCSVAFRTCLRANVARRFDRCAAPAGDQQYRPAEKRRSRLRSGRADFHAAASNRAAIAATGARAAFRTCDELRLPRQRRAQSGAAPILQRGSVSRRPPSTTVWRQGWACAFAASGLFGRTMMRL